MMNKLAVIGVGSAGIQSLCHSLAWLDKSWEIYSIHSPKIPISGIGESTNPRFLDALGYGLDFLLHRDLSDINGTLKFGTKYTDWRKEPFYNPLLNGNLAIHFDTSILAKWAIPRFKKIWNNKFKIIEGEVTNIRNEINCVSIEVNDKTYEFDYVIDCSGSPSIDDENYFKPKILLNACLVHNIEGGSGNPIENTGHIATPDGWMFRVPLANRISYGYLFNDTITPLNTAKRNFSKQIDVPGDKLQGIEYFFEPYVLREVTKGRITQNGNAAVFFEPMFANSLFLYDTINRVTLDRITDNMPIDAANEIFLQDAKRIFNTIAFHYLGGSTYSTTFWEYAKNWGKEVIKESPGFESYLKELGTYTKSIDGWSSALKINDTWAGAFPPIGMRDISRNLEYNYL